MDATAIAALTSQVITFITPFVSKAGEAIATKTGEAVFEQGRHLYEMVRARFAKEPDGGRASKVLQNFSDDPQEYVINLDSKLNSLLASDAEFAEALKQIVQAGPKQSIEVGDYGIASHNSQQNSVGRGEQTMKGGTGASLYDNSQKID